MFKDKVNIRCKENNNYISEIRINGNTIPYVTGYNLHQGVGERPELNLELTIGDLNYEGPAEIKIDDVIFDNKKLAKDVYNRIKDKYDFD